MKRSINLLFLFLAVVIFSATATCQSHSVTLNWAASSDAAANPALAYNVYRFTGSCPANPTIASFTKVGSAVSATTFADTAVSVGNTYCYAVTATLNGGESGLSNTASGTIPIAPPGALVITLK